MTTASASNNALHPTIEPYQLTPQGFAAAPFTPLQAASVGASVRAVNLDRVRIADLDADAVVKQDLPINLAVCHFLVRRRETSSLATYLTGLRRLCEYHGSRPLSMLTGTHLEQDRERIVEETRAKLESQEGAVADEKDEWLRTRREQLLADRIARDGEGAWRNYLDAVRALYSVMESTTQLALRKPTDGILVPKGQAGMYREAMTEAQMQAHWLATLSEEDPELALLILDTLRETACRVSSLVGLNLEDFDWARGGVTLRTKNRLLHYTAVSQDLLMRYAKRGRAQGWSGEVPRSYNSNDFRRAPMTGTPALRRKVAGDTYVRVTKKVVTDLFTRLDRRAGDLARPKVTAHVVRHTTLTQVERICGLEAAARWAGHRKRETQSRSDQTNRYVKWMRDERIALLNLMFPETPVGGWDPVANRPAR